MEKKQAKTNARRLTKFFIRCAVGETRLRENVIRAEMKKSMQLLFFHPNDERMSVMREEHLLVLMYITNLTYIHTSILDLMSHLRMYFWQ